MLLRRLKMARPVQHRNRANTNRIGAKYRASMDWTRMDPAHASAATMTSETPSASRTFRKADSAEKMKSAPLAARIARAEQPDRGEVDEEPARAEDRQRCDRAVEGGPDRICLQQIERDRDDGDGVHEIEPALHQSSGDPYQSQRQRYQPEDLDHLPWRRRLAKSRHHRQKLTEGARIA